MVKVYGSVKRFGARYGRTLKYKVGKIEAARKQSLCPYCNSKNVVRMASGIWNCKKCKSKFTGRAYTVKKTVEEG